LSAFNKLADALSAVRNEYGALAHGKDGFFGGLTRDENRAFLHTGDAVLAILLNAFEGKSPDPASTREPYERFDRFNKEIDRRIEVQAEVDDADGPPVILITITAAGSRESIPLSVEPSRFLFEIDREAYVELLNASLDVGKSEITEQISSDGDGFSITTTESIPLSAHDGTVLRFASNYEGRLTPFATNLHKFLEAESVVSSVDAEGSNLQSSLLATADDNLSLDLWKSESRQARLNVALHRVFARFGVPQSRSLATKLVTWLRIQSAGLEERVS
jgi:hypothetical protein